MSIILHENEWAKNMLDACDLGSKPSETLRRVARYYLDEGNSKESVRKNLENFILQCDRKVSIQNWSNAVDYAIKKAVRSPSVNIDSIKITDSEMSKINVLDGIQIKRLAFTLLCLAKYHNTVKENNNCWVNTKDNAIMSIANIRTSVKKQSSMYKKLKDIGMIQFSKRVDNINIRVNFITGGKPVMNIKDFRNLGYQYIMYCGEPYFECECCGITTKIKDPKNKRRQKYCNECAKKIKIERTEASAIRYKKNSQTKKDGN